MSFWQQKIAKPESWNLSEVESENSGSGRWVCFLLITKSQQEFATTC
jgi:hypothetical protein